MPLFWAFIVVVIVAYVFCFLACAGLNVLLEIPTHLLTGWYSFLKSNLSQIRPDWTSVSIGMVATGICYVILTRLITRWKFQLPTEVVKNRRKLSCQLLLLVIAFFAVGTSVIGIVHQCRWLTGNQLLTNNYHEFSKATSKNNLKQAGLAVYNYHDEHHKIPHAILHDENGRALHSFWTTILPYYFEQDIYEQVNLELPWNHESNLSLFETKIDPFLNPGVYAIDLQTPEQEKPLAAAHYALNKHVFLRDKQLRLGDITDGVSSTILIGEIRENCEPWGKPGHLRDPAHGFNTHPFGFGSPRKYDVSVTLIDGSIRSFSNDIDPDVLRALATPNGGDEIPDEGW